MKIPEQAVFDTNILIDYSHGVPEARAAVKGCAAPVISLVTWIEFLAGFPLPEQERVRSFLLTNFDIVYPDEEIADGVIAFRRQKRFKLPDAMIYATALSRKIPLITRNTKDFDENQPDIYVPYRR